MSIKVCSKCGIEKPLDDFHNDPRKQGRKRPRCKECLCAQRRTYGVKNRERETEWRRKWYAENRERCIERHRPAKQKWAKENRDKVLACSKVVKSKRRARGLVGRLNTTAFKNWLSAQLMNCVWCAANCSDKYHIDHVIPLAKGGAHDLTNFAISCPSCNLSKADKMPLEWLALRA